jgi:hypothetical protein
VQHWDYVLANNIPYLEAQIIKYLTRWRKKNGFQDLEKAQHFLSKLIEVNTPISTPWPEQVGANPTKSWPKREYCSCKTDFPCPLHPEGEATPEYVNQDR